MAMGDALAVTLLKLRNFRPEDYALFHPGGSLGKQLVTTAGDLMDIARLPQVREQTPVEQAIQEIQDKGYGVTCVVNTRGLLCGAFSMGDFTRLHLKDRSLGFLQRPIAEVMTRTPKTVTADVLAARALNVMETHHIRAIFVIDGQGKPLGILGLYEVLKAIDY